MRIRKIVCIAFISALLLALVNVTSSAFTSGDFIIESGVLTKYTGTGGTVKIPENLGIKKIGEYVFNNNSSITSVVIPHGVTLIQQSAFNQCVNLISVTLPTSVTEIQSYAFFGCRNLSSINVPAGLKTVGTCAFAETNIGSPIFADNGRTLCHVPDSYSEYEIPKTVKVIGGGAFYECHNMSSIIIPEGVTLIDHTAFAFCLKLTSVTLPEGVTTIGANAFLYCMKLQNITIPDSVTSIGTCPFDTTDLKEPVLINGGKTLCYVPTSYLDYTIPDTVTKINGGAFKDCAGLKSVVIADKVTSIGDNAFNGCVSLTSVKLPAGIKTIDWATFSGCSSLTAITIPDSVTMISFDAFRDCSNLSYIRIPDSLTTILQRAFIGCNNLNMIRIPPGVREIRSGVFDEMSKVILAVREGSFAQAYAISNGLEYALDQEANPTQSAVFINGVQVNFDAYTIGGNNYFKLRDLAMALNGTVKQFEVTWDEVNYAIVLTSQKTYTSIGNELTGSAAKQAAAAIRTVSKIYLDGVEVSPKAYQIGSNNYFKLRDIGAAMNFSVVWDEATKAIVVDTSTGYTA